MPAQGRKVTVIHEQAERAPTANFQAARGRGRSIKRTITPGLGRARGIEARIRRFSPSWFSVTMGSGIPSNLCYLMPWSRSHAAFRAIGAAFLIFDMALFSLFSIMFITRYILYPQILPATLRHETHSLFIGTIPMGFVTLVTAIANYGVGYGIPTVMTASVLFWVAMVLSLFSICIVPFYMMTVHKNQSERMNASWLLPFVPPLTIAACGSTISHYLVDSRPEYAFNIALASYVMLGLGIFPSLSILVLYIQRLALYQLPPKEVIISTFLPLGPCGQSGYAAIQLGSVLTQLLPVLSLQHPDSTAWQTLSTLGGPAYIGGIIYGLLMFGYGFWFAFLAVASIIAHYSKKREEPVKSVFHLGFWSTTFPTGSLNLLVYSLADAFDNMFFKVLGTIMTAVVIVFWACVIVPTFYGFKRGTLFDAPCLENVAEDEESLSAQLKSLADGSEVNLAQPIASNEREESRATTRTEDD